MTTTPSPWGSWKNKTMGLTYQMLRMDCAELEQLIEQAEVNGTLDDITLKRLDKSVTVMKAGMKIMKKALKQSQKLKRPNVTEKEHEAAQ